MGNAQREDVAMMRIPVKGGEYQSLGTAGAGRGDRALFEKYLSAADRQIGEHLTASRTSEDVGFFDIYDIKTG